ncbi:uncharacterized protein FIBRA_04413 [Fibroporia radiculosa]|uniref:Uncharacterized protein n=1 Tax=Fibroporia radiculosa TaxID=599839 RepID=J4IA55_9APHY|nr:uncharacterized protein FIBRA_04413 [Fibroporia radiculosa]CCM02321.1 predicted protein [Fibroporia radiculosa]
MSEKSGNTEGVTVLTRGDSRNNGHYFSHPTSPEPRAAPPQPAAPVHQIGDPTPLGMLAYGTVFLCSSLLTLGVGGVTTPNLVLVFAMFYGGISQTLVGMWEFYLGHTFAATVFATYGGFNFSYGALYLPEIGLASAYSVNGVVTEEFTHAVGIYLAIWCLITGLFFIGALRTTGPIVWTLGMTVIALACLSANCFNVDPHLGTAGGAFGLAATAGAYYGALSGFYSRASTFEQIRLPPVVLAYSDPQSA